MFRIEEMPGSIDIGYTGETCFRKIEIDMTKWMEDMPDGVPSIIHIRPWETKEDAYIAATTFADNILTWEITDADLGTQEGDGVMQVWLEEEENDSVVKRGKSVKVITKVTEAADDPAEEPPAAQQAWITQMTALKDAIVAAQAHGPIISESTHNWEVWDTEEENYVDTGVYAVGFPLDRTLASEDSAAPADMVGDLKSEIEDILVYQEGSGGDSVTLTNLENTTDFKTGISTSGLYTGSVTDGIYSTTAKASDNENSPYALDAGAWGNKKWIAGFKYRITKLDETLGEPSSIRIHLGASQYYDETPIWGEWVDFSKTVTLDMTRIRFAVRGFATVPPNDSFKVEIKNMYLYDATDVSADMCAYIMAQQSENYQDGTVTYGGGEEGYFPDTTLAIEGKAADSKAVGDAIASVRANVKDFGVKGDGQTDDTDAINTLFANGGVFYFPAGTYKISGTITLPSESEMYGDGDQTVIDMYSCDDLEAKTFRGGDKIYPYICVSNSDNTKLHDFKLIGNNTLQEKRHGAVCVLDSANCDIRNLTIFNINYDATQQGDATVSGYGICVNRSEFVTVEKCNVEQCGYECIGIVDDCDFCTVRDCFTKNGWRTCIQVHRGSCNTLIENNYMLQNHDKYDACFTVHGVTAQHVVNLRVLNNTMECQQNGDQGQTYCAPAQIMSYTDAFVFIGNRVLGGKRAFFITSDSEDAKIMGNDFNCNSASDYGVWIDSLHTIVIGNRLDDEASTPTNHIANSPVSVGNIGIANN